MKKITQKDICCIPLFLWIVVLPVMVKIKFYENPLIDYSWYSNEPTLADFFLYYKSIIATASGVLMLAVLFWQIGKMRKKGDLFTVDTRIFIPLVIYLVLVAFSSLFSEYKYFCIHGMPDQFETVWVLIAYVIAVFYCYYLVVYQNAERSILVLIYISAALVGLICVLQYFKIDIYRLIYAGENYSFTFEEGTVYGPFYNTNYVGCFTLLFAPLFALFLALYKDLKVKIISGVLLIAVLIAMFGAQSSTAEIALVGVIVFAVVFILIKNARTKKILWIPVITMIIAGVIVCVVAAPRLSAYVQASDTEKNDLENIYTHDDCVEVDYRGQQLFIRMYQEESILRFHLLDQYQMEISTAYTDSPEGYYYYTVNDDRFSGITLTPAMITEDPETYGFMLTADEKSWCFTNQIFEDGTYYYYTDQRKFTKLTDENVSVDFTPLENKCSLASGRGYIWNKTITLLKDYLLFGSGADTFALVYPNNDFVDKYNNWYDNMIITKPHNMYLQIAVQTGMLSLICFLVFYAWYFISSLRLYFRQRLEQSLVVTGFSIMLGTLGYMISGIANDSTITVAPLFWAMMGIGIGINHRIRTESK